VLLLDAEDWMLIVAGVTALAMFGCCFVRA